MAAGGGKGIAPDVFVPSVAPSRAEALLVKSGAFFDFGGWVRVMHCIDVRFNLMH